jgi:hypothetical protein
MANGWALGKFGGEFAQVTQTYVGQLQSFGSLTDITSRPRQARENDMRRSIASTRQGHFQKPNVSNVSISILHRWSELRR